MSEVLYEYGAKFDWHLKMLLGVFLMIFGIDLVILFFLNRNDILIFIIVLGLYGIATIIILISMLGVFIVKRYGMKGDIILRGTIIGIIWLIPIILSIIVLSIINFMFLWLYWIAILILFLVSEYLEKKRIEKKHIPNPDADLRFLHNLGTLFAVVFGIILIPIGIYVNDLILRFLPWIYYIGSYGLAFYIIGGILIFYEIYGLYHGRKEKRENQQIIKEKKEDLDWLGHQYYEKGRSIQDIADELNVSMMKVKKWLHKLENSTN